MTQPWFDPNLYAWIPGTTLGCLAGVWGALAGVLAPRGKARGLVWGMWIALMVASVLLLILGVIAWVQGQPYGVWYGLGYPGLLCLILLAALGFIVRLRYRQVEARRVQARDL